MGKNRFRRGFLITDSEIKNKCLEELKWMSKKIGPYYIQYDPAVECFVEKDQDLWVCCLGIFMDTVEYVMNITYISNKIMGILKQEKDIKNNTKLWEYLDFLNGRYIVLWGREHENEFYLVNDATGMRGVWYSKTMPVIASHYGLVQLVTKDEYSSFWEIFKKQCKFCRDRHLWAETWCMPGDLSPYNNIHLLISNHCLSINDRDTFRFWPRENMPQVDIETVAEYIAETITKEAETLAKRYDVMFSLTMGNDSRMSLAAFRSIKDRLTYFTYAHMQDDWRNGHFMLGDEYYNVQWSEKICRDENLNYKLLDISNAILDPELERDLQINHYHVHKRLAIPAMTEMVETRNAYHEEAIHLRSNLIEIVRKSYFDLFNWDNDIHKLAFMMAKWSMYHVEFEGFDEIVKYYEQLIQANAANTIYNYDIGTIFYMEYRMNQWQGAAVLTNTDPVFDTFMLFNQRKILNYGMSIPKLYKDNNILVTSVIEKLWPELLNEKMPNILLSNWKMADWNLIKAKGIVRFDTDIQDKKQYVICSGNRQDLKRNVKIIEEPRLTGIRFGFAETDIRKDDYVELILKHNIVEGKQYCYEFDVFTHYTSYTEMMHAGYEIWINDRKIYALGMNTFPNRINQILYAFDAKETKENIVKIRIIVHKNADGRLINGMLDVRNIFLREEYRGAFGKEIISASEQRLR